MGNPYPSFKNISTRQNSGPVQCISDTKFSTKTYAAGVAPASLDFFTGSPSTDPTLDNYDLAGVLVTSGKSFCIQGITCNVIGTAIADIDAIIQKGVAVLTCQNKEIGRFRLRNLTAAGGTFIAGAQGAAASIPGVINGLPQSEPWRISELMIEANQSFKITIFMPTVTPYTVTAATTVELGLVGYEVRPTA